MRTTAPHSLSWRGPRAPGGWGKKNQNPKDHTRTLGLAVGRANTPDNAQESLPEGRGSRACGGQQSRDTDTRCGCEYPNGPLSLPMPPRKHMTIQNHPFSLGVSRPPVNGAEWPARRRQPKCAHVGTSRNLSDPMRTPAPHSPSWRGPRAPGHSNPAHTRVAAAPILQAKRSIAPPPEAAPPNSKS